MCWWARHRATNAPPVDAEKVRQAMQTRDYPAAIKAIGEAAQAKGAPRDYLTYLCGLGACLQKEYDAAATTLDKFQHKFSQSPWRRREVCQGGRICRKGDFREPPS